MPFDWIVEYAPDEDAFAKTWKRSKAMDAKATVIGLVELRETGELRRSVAALLEVLEVAKKPRKRTVVDWLGYVEVALRAYARGGVRDVEALQRIQVLQRAHVGWYINQVASVRAGMDAINAMLTSSPLTHAFRAATDQGSHRFAFAMKQLDALAPTLAQIVELS